MYGSTNSRRPGGHAPRTHHAPRMRSALSGIAQLEYQAAHLRLILVRPRDCRRLVSNSRELVSNCRHLNHPASTETTMLRSFSSGVVRRGRVSTLLPGSQSRPWPYSAAPFSAQMAPHPTSTITMRNANPSVDTAHLRGMDRQVEVEWRNGHQSLYDWTWLRVNCPSFVHESGQRTVFPGDIDPEVKPLQVRACVL